MNPLPSAGHPLTGALPLGKGEPRGGKSRPKAVEPVDVPPAAPPIAPGPGQGVREVLVSGAISPQSLSPSVGCPVFC